MKRIIFSYLAVAVITVSATLTSCDNKDDEKTLTLSKKNVEITSEGGEDIITVTSNTSWEVLCGADWIEVEPSRKTGNGNILIKVKRNETFVKRTTSIIVSTLSVGINEEIVVEQEAGEKNRKKVKLLETVKNIHSDVAHDKYEYDSQNRITKLLWYDNDGKLWGSKTFTYDGADLVKVIIVKSYTNISTEEFTRNGDVITINCSYLYGIQSLHLNSDGLPDRQEVIMEDYYYLDTYDYQNGNLVKYIHKFCQKIEDDFVIIAEDNTNYKYDDKKSPFYNSNFPKWYMIWDFDWYGIHNNVIERDDITFEYDYDTDGFPTKCTITNSYGETSVIEFNYTN
jgi:hypothetical protein